MDNRWELYSDHKDFRKAINELERTWKECVVCEMPEDETEKHMYRVMTKYRHVGATDTEPRWELERRMKALRQYYKSKKEVMG
jgi:hypothetical protein